MSGKVQRSDQIDTQPVALLVPSGKWNASFFQQHLSGYRLFEAPDDLSMLVSSVGSYEPGLVIFDCLTLSDEVISAVQKLQAAHPVAVLIFADHGDAAHAQAAMRAGASACVIDGLQAHRLESIVAIAVERYRLFCEMHLALKKTQETLAARKIIDKAKGILMEQRGLRESEAYELIRQSAMAQSRTMREVSESVLMVAGIIC